MHGRCVAEGRQAEGTRGLLLKGHFDDVEPLCGSWQCPQGFVCSCKARMLPPDNELEKPPYAYADPETGDPGCVFQEGVRSWVEDGEFNPEPQCPHYGFECFDNFGIALYTIFTKITLDTWTGTMWWAQDVAGDSVGLVFFMTLIGIIAFNVINLNVAIISTAYQEVRNERREIDRTKAERARQMEEKRTSGTLLGPPEQPASPLFAKIAAVLQDWYEYGTQRRTAPLNRTSMLARRFTTYPLTVDECGSLVAVDIPRMAAERNLQVI